MNINYYSFGKIIIGNREFDRDVIIYKNKVETWTRKQSHNVEPSDLYFDNINININKEKLELVIIGTGYSGVMQVPDETRKFIQDKSLKLIIQKTPDAVKTFNKLKQEKIAFFHLTC